MATNHENEVIDDTKYYFSVEINIKSMPAFVDFGSNVVTMDKSALRSLVIKDDQTLNFFKKCPENAKVILRSENDVVIPPKYTGFVKCFADNGGEFYVNGCLRAKDGEEVVISNFIFKIERKSAVF